MADEFEKRLQPWRVFAVGQRVLVVKGLRKGERGTIAERLDDRLDGYARYGVRLDSLVRFDGTGGIADYCRHELTVVRAKRTGPHPGKPLKERR